MFPTQRTVVEGAFDMGKREHLAQLKGKLEEAIKARDQSPRNREW